LNPGVTACGERGGSQGTDSFSWLCLSWLCQTRSIFKATLWRCGKNLSILSYSRSLRLKMTETGLGTPPKLSIDPPRISRSLKRPLKFGDSRRCFSHLLAEAIGLKTRPYDLGCRGCGTRSLVRRRSLLSTVSGKPSVRTPWRVKWFWRVQVFFCARSLKH